jgi:hypothetical protein
MANASAASTSTPGLVGASFKASAADCRASAGLPKARYGLISATTPETETPENSSIIK